MCILGGDFMKDNFVRVRLTSLEKNKLRVNAENLGMSMSDYIKYCCLIDKPNLKKERILINE